MLILINHWSVKALSVSSLSGSKKRGWGCWTSSFWKCRRVSVPSLWPFPCVFPFTVSLLKSDIQESHKQRPTQCKFCGVPKFSPQTHHHTADFSPQKPFQIGGGKQDLPVCRRKEVWWFNNRFYEKNETEDRLYKKKLQGILQNIWTLFLIVSLRLIVP